MIRKLLQRILLILVAFFTLSSSVLAQTSIYKTLQTPFYDPGQDCSSGSQSSSGLVWPFATKNESQYNRVDQGWDIQSDAGAAIYAIASGTISVFAPDNGGFGNDYPTEKLDTSIGGPSDWIYYGHVHVLPGVVDKHVDAGQQIAVANKTDPENGSAAPPGWLEIGFAIPGTDAPIAKGGGYEAATPEGQKMKDILLQAQPANVSADSQNGSTAQCCSDTNLVGSVNEEKIFNYFISKGLTPPQTAGIMGNMQSESAGTWNPRVIQGDPPTFGDYPVHGKGFGLAQWTTDSRQQELVKRAQAAGKLPSDLGVQLDYVWWELTEGPKKSVGDQLKATTDLQSATYLILSQYEAPADIEGNKPVRLRYATIILAKYGSGSPSGSSSSCDTVTDPNFSMIKLSPPLATPGGKITPKGITLHWWGDSTHGQNINTLVSALRGNASCGAGGCSVQVGITADGKVYQMTNSLTDLTYHAIGANETTIGIEIGGTSTDFGKAGMEKYPAKFNAVVSTVKYLVNKYNIPLDGKVVCGNVSGIHPHTAYNSCPNATQKSDIDDYYFNAVMQKVRG